MSESIINTPSNQLQRPPRRRTVIPRAFSERTRGDIRERSSETHTLLLQDYTPQTRVSGNTARLDKMKLKINLGFMISTPEELEQTRMYLGAAPTHYREDSIRLYGLLCRNSPYAGMNNSYSNDIRKTPLTINGRSWGVPLFTGRINLKKSNQELSDASASIETNPTRAYNLNFERLLSEESWKDKIIAPVERRNALVSLDGNNNILHSNTSLASYKRCERLYFESLSNAIVGSLNDATAFSNGSIHTSFSWKEVALKEIEHYWEFTVDDSLEFLDRLKEPVLAFRRDSRNRIHDEQAVDFNIDKNAKTLTLFLTNGESIKVYAKLSNRIRIEVTHKPPKQNGLIDGGYVAQSNLQFRQKLEALKARAVEKVNTLLEHVELWNENSPQELAKTTHFSCRWFKNLGCSPESENLLSLLKSNGRICGGVGLVTREHRNKLRMAKAKGLVRVINGVFYPSTGEKELTELNSEFTTMRHTSETHCVPSELSNPLAIRLEWSSGSFLPSPPCCSKTLEKPRNLDRSIPMKDDLTPKTVTQTKSDKVQYTIRRDGTYYFKKRIPTDLVEAVAFGLNKAGNPKEVFIYSLHTKDPKEARRIVATENFKIENEIALKRQELEGVKEDKIIRRINSDSKPTRKFSSLSAPERRNIILNHFLELENKANEWRFDSLEEVEKEEAKDNIKENLGIIQGSPSYEQMDWDAMLSSYLADIGIEPDVVDKQEFKEMRSLYQRAYVESYSKSLQLLEKGISNVNDPYFSECDGVPEIPKIDLTPSISIKELSEKFIEYKERGVTKKTADKYRLRSKIMMKFWGENTSIKEITVHKAKEIILFLSEIPTTAHISNEYKNISLTEASFIEAKKDNPRFISPKTQEDSFIDMKAIFRYAYEHEWIASNPFDKKIVRDLLPKVNSVSPPPPTVEEFNVLFSYDPYLQLRHAGGKGEARFWLPLLCLFQGFRANEACQLLVEDVQVKDGIPCILIRETDDNGNIVKKIKSDSSKRIVPIHKEIIKMGFLDLVNRQKEVNETFLFSALSANADGSRADATCKWFGDFKDEVFDTSPIRGAKGIHSLRHAFVTACRRGEVEPQIRWVLGGWSGDNVNSESGYGEYEMEVLEKASSKIKYEGVDLSNLYPVKDKAIRKRTRKKD